MLRHCHSWLALQYIVIVFKCVFFIIFPHYFTFADRERSSFNSGASILNSFIFTPTPHTTGSISGEGVAWPQALSSIQGKLLQLLDKIFLCIIFPLTDSPHF